MNDRRHRNRAIAFAALGVAALLLLFFFQSREDSSTAPAPKSSGPRVVYGPAPPAPPPVPPPPPPIGEPPKPKPPGQPPIIDEIIVEKPEVCAGEENLITVRAHTVDGNDVFLHYTIGGDTGAAVPVRAYLDDDKKVAAHKLVVFGGGNVATTVDVPPYVVKECPPSQSAFVTAQLRANTWSDFDFSAKLVDLGGGDAGGAPKIVPSEYRWSFGDGKSETTTTPFVTHSYEDRPQTALYSQMLITVEIVGAGGEKIVGRKSLQLRNPVFEDFYEKGIVSLMIALTPRFPEANAEGVVIQGVRLFHARPTSITIEKAVRIKQYPEQGGETAPEPVDPTALLGTTVIPAGRGIETKVAFDTAAEPDIFSVTYLLDGKTPEGWPVRGGFSVMRPPPKPTKESSNPVLDPALRAKIVAARKILGKDFVTDEDLFQLEKEGKFVGLVIDDSPIPAPSEPPKNLPKPPNKIPANAKGAPPPEAPPPIGPTAAPSIANPPQPPQPPPKVTKP